MIIVKGKFVYLYTAIITSLARYAFREIQFKANNVFFLYICIMQINFFFFSIEYEQKEERNYFTRIYTQVANVYSTLDFFFFLIKLVTALQFA